jgi:small-conductance mechanosensitive channel
MVEAFDAADSSRSLQGISILLAWILLGVVLELLVLQRLRAWTTRRGWFISEVVLTALSGQALYWCFVVGLFTTLAQVVPNVRIIDLVRSLLGLLSTLAVTLFLVRLIINAIRLYFVRREVGSISLINNTLRFLGGLALICTALALLGVPIGPLITVLAGSSIGLSLALRDPLANLFSGMTVLASSKVQPGDYIRLSSGQEGIVTDIRWSDTYIRELPDNMIIIPNALMTSTIITNFDQPASELSVLFELGVRYDSDLAEVERLVVAAATEVLASVPGGVSDFTPLVRYQALGDSVVRFTAILRAQSFVDQFLLKHEFVKRLQASFAAAGLPPPTPIQLLRLEREPERAPAPGTPPADTNR